MNKKGFTLVELSIVLVVIGLVAAAVSVGRELVVQAKFRGILSEAEQYKSITNTFQAKFDQIQGDITNAHDYWGSSCDATASNCNGDGNGFIDAHPSATDNEMFRGWQHLYLAGMIPEALSGEGETGTYEASLGINIPESKYSGVGYMIRYATLYGSSVNARGHVLSLGSGIGAYSYNYNPYFTAPQAYQIDKKIDDGLPIKGRFRGYHPAFGLPYCRTTNDAETALYSLTRTTQQECTLHWLIAN